MNRDTEDSVAGNPLGEMLSTRVDADALEMVREAKRQTGRSLKFLVSEALRAKFARYRSVKRKAA